MQRLGLGENKGNLYHFLNQYVQVQNKKETQPYKAHPRTKITSMGKKVYDKHILPYGL